MYKRRDGTKDGTKELALTILHIPRGVVDDDDDDEESRQFQRSKIRRDKKTHARRHRRATIKQSRLTAVALAPSVQTFPGIYCCDLRGAARDAVTAG